MVTGLISRVYVECKIEQITLLRTDLRLEFDFYWKWGGGGGGVDGINLLITMEINNLGAYLFLLLNEKNIHFPISFEI